MSDPDAQPASQRAEPLISYRSGLDDGEEKPTMFAIARMIFYCCFFGVLWTIFCGAAIFWGARTLLARHDFRAVLVFFPIVLFSFGLWQSVCSLRRMVRCKSRHPFQ